LYPKLCLEGIGEDGSSHDPADSFSTWGAVKGESGLSPIQTPEKSRKGGERKVKRGRKGGGKNAYNLRLRLDVNKVGPQDKTSEERVLYQTSAKDSKEMVRVWEVTKDIWKTLKRGGKKGPDVT